MTFNVYFCALEQKLTHKETTKDHEHQKVPASTNWKVVEKVEKKLAKHGRLDKRVVKKLFDEKVVYQALCKKGPHSILQLKLMNLYQGTPTKPPYVESHHPSKSSTWQQ
jgi:hypothetical protein